MVIAYMAGKKHKANSKLYLHTHMRKMHDAILFGARTVKKSLPLSYYSEMDSRLSSFKRKMLKQSQKATLTKGVQI